jgi:hypothetical protein
MAIFKCVGVIVCWFSLSFTICFGLHGHLHGCVRCFYFHMPEGILDCMCLLSLLKAYIFLMISKFILQSVVIHLAEWGVRLQWLGERHSIEPLLKQ